jgi:hypothetical protein
MCITSRPLLFITSSERRLRKQRYNRARDTRRERVCVRLHLHASRSIAWRDVAERQRVLSSESSHVSESSSVCYSLKGECLIGAIGVPWPKLTYRVPCLKTFSEEKHCLCLRHIDRIQAAPSPHQANALRDKQRRRNVSLLNVMTALQQHSTVQLDTAENTYYCVDIRNA